jgi:hypothetical protein
LKAIESQEHCGIVHRTSRVTSDDEARCLECGLPRAADRVLRLFYFGSDDGGSSRIRPEDRGRSAAWRLAPSKGPGHLPRQKSFGLHGMLSLPCMNFIARRSSPGMDTGSIGSELIGVETARLRSRSAGFDAVCWDRRVAVSPLPRPDYDLRNSAGQSS